MASIYQRNGVWQIKYRKPGHQNPVRESLRIKNKRVAEKKKKNFEKRYETAADTTPSTSDEYTIARLADEFYEAKARTMQQPSVLRTTIRTLKKHFGHMHPEDFSPLEFRELRKIWIDEGRLLRSTINEYAGQCKNMFRWAATGGSGQVLIPVQIYQALDLVPGVRRGEYDNLKESSPKRPVSVEDRAAIKPQVAPTIYDMVQLQYLTGLRPGNLVQLTPGDIDTTEAVWTAELIDHKTANMKPDDPEPKKYFIAFGPKAQVILNIYMLRPAEKYLFNPRKVIVQTRAQYATTRRRPNQADTPRRTQRKVGEKYTTGSYRRAITRACEAAGITKWTPTSSATAAPPTSVSNSVSKPPRPSCSTPPSTQPKSTQNAPSASPPKSWSR